MQSDQSIKGFTTRKFINPQTGEVSYKYFWKRNEVPKIEITGPLVNRLSGLTLIQKDLTNCISWIKKAKEMTSLSIGKENAEYVSNDDRETFNVVKALFVASLSFYGKCFTEASGRGAQVSRNWLSKEFKSSHDYHMKYRHNFAAHSGDENVEIAKTFVLLHPKRKMEFLPFLPTVRNQPDFIFSTESETDFEYLLLHVAELVNDKYQKLGEKIIDELISPKGIDFWHEKFKNKTTVELGYPKKNS